MYAKVRQDKTKWKLSIQEKRQQLCSKNTWVWDSQTMSSATKDENLYMRDKTAVAKEQQQEKKSCKWNNWAVKYWEWRIKCALFFSFFFNASWQEVLRVQHLLHQNWLPQPIPDCILPFSWVSSQGQKAHWQDAHTRSKCWVSVEGGCWLAHGIPGYLGCNQKHESPGQSW